MPRAANGRIHDDVQDAESVIPGSRDIKDPPRTQGDCVWKCGDCRISHLSPRAAARGERSKFERSLNFG
jgi:hypothetical protein